MASKVFEGNNWKERIKGSIEDADINDACFRAKDELGRSREIKCSRVILSLASPVFRKQFFGPLKAKYDKLSRRNISAKKIWTPKCCIFCGLCRVGDDNTILKTVRAEDQR